jgi:hypothetical protein
MRREKSSTIVAAVLCSILIGAMAVRFLTQISGAHPSHTTNGPESNPAGQSLLCGQRNDGQIHLPPDWSTFRPPAARQSYADPAFGCRITRLTESSSEEILVDGTHPALMNFYSTTSPMNATDTLLLIVSDSGAWRIKDSAGNEVVPADKMPVMNNGHPVWDAKDGSIFYFTRGKTLYTGTVSGQSLKTTELQTFKEYRGIVSPDAADLSQDGDHIALAGEGAGGTIDVFVWSLGKRAKTSLYTPSCKLHESITGTTQPGCIHKVELTPNNLLSIQFASDGVNPEQGVRLWDGSRLTGLQDATNHYDTGFDLEGRPIFIEVGNSRTLHGLNNPCPSGWGLDVRQLDDVAQAACLLDKQPAWHVSYRGSASQPWAAMSFFDDRKPGPELFDNDRGFQAPSPANWRLYEDEIILARVDGSAVYRLAHARSRSAEAYWAQPHAAISRDGKYVTFTSNMAYPEGCPPNTHVPGDCTDVYLIKVR